MNQENNWILEIVENYINDFFKKHDRDINECFASLKFNDEIERLNLEEEEQLKYKILDTSALDFVFYNGNDSIDFLKIEDLFLNELEQKIGLRRGYMIQYFGKNDVIPGLEEEMKKCGLFNVRTMYDLSVYVVQSYINGHVGTIVEKLLNKFVEDRKYIVVDTVNLVSMINESIEKQKKKEKKKLERKKKIIKKKNRKKK